MKTEVLELNAALNLFEGMKWEGQDGRLGGTGGGGRERKRGGEGEEEGGRGGGREGLEGGEDRGPRA